MFADTGLDYPTGLAFDSAGALYAANEGSGTIEKFAPNGTGSVFASTGLSRPFGLAFDAAGNLYAANYGNNTIEKFAADGTGSQFAGVGLDEPTGLTFDAAGNLYVVNQGGQAGGFILKFTADGASSAFATAIVNTEIYGLVFAQGPPSFFHGEVSVGNGVNYLSFPNGNYFGYYSYLADPRYIYHFDLGYEYVFDAADGKNGVYLYDFASSTFFLHFAGLPIPVPV